MGMKVHVTGAGGFIGRNLMSALARYEHDAVPAVAGADAVVHLAAIAHRHASRDELDQVNVRLSARLAREAAACGARFLFLSSVKVHGEQSEQPFTERSAIAPADPYAASKARAEEALHAVPGLPLAILRPPLVYGPGVKANFLLLMRAVARGWPLPLGAVHNRRSLVYVGNLVDAIVRCLTANGTYLISDGGAVSTPQLCRELGEVLGRPARLLPFPPALLPAKVRASLEVDDRALRERLGWRAPHGRAAGLRATADWYRRR
jgi:nucleoside-diphosphate-sugar epimerase